MNVRPNALPTALALLLLLSACEDPSNVGLGLIGESGGEPELISLPVEDLLPTDAPEHMGGVVAHVGTNPTPRFLAGTVDDPLLGFIEAMGYVDFQLVGGISEGFRAGPVSSATLIFTPDYVYGDTTSVVSLQVSEVTDAWDAGSPVDTTIAPARVLAAVTVPPTIGTLEIPLPDEWVQENDALLRSTTFTADMQGFEVRSTAGNAVLGFGTTSARFQVVSAGDTVRYTMQRALTTTRSQPVASTNPFVMQDGLATARVLVLPDTVSAIGPAGVNGALIRLPIDTLAIHQQKPPGFVRPMLEQVWMTGRVRGNDGEMSNAFVVSATLSGGVLLWPNRSIPEGFFQDMLAGREVELRVAPANSSFTINPIFLSSPGSAERDPVVVLTLTRAGV